jgi:hypothetical protein
MKRQILRFPVGQQFQKILEDDHEWFVITDKRLKILVAKRGAESFITKNVSDDAFSELRTKMKDGQIIEVYTLHSHPYEEGDGAYQRFPSVKDMDYFITNKYLGKKYIVEVGQGIITKKGILLIKLPEYDHKIKDMVHRVSFSYMNNVRKQLNTKLNTNSDDVLNVALSSLPEKQKSKLIINAHEKAFKKLIKEEPDIKTKRIGRTHIVNMRRLRR